MPRFSCRRAAAVFALLASGASLSACATQAPSPSIAVMPKPGESFSEFQQHDMTCRAYATNVSGANSQDGASKAVGGAAIGAGLGAATGALLGSASGHAGNGAAIGAGSGLLLGTVLGGSRAQKAAEATQHRYDIAYAQCMSANGERLPAPPPRYVYGPPVVYGPPPPPYPQN